MKVLYLIFFIVALLLLLLDSFSPTNSDRSRGRRFAVRFLPLALFFAILVPTIQLAKTF